MGETAIILAAGRSSRMRPLCDNTPKCLLPMGTKTILDWQFEAIRKIGVHDVLMVVGYRSEMIQQHVFAKYPSLSVKFIENARFAATNTLHSLGLALEVYTGDFYSLNADVVFDERILQRLQSAGTEGGYLAVDRKQCRDEEVKVRVQANEVKEIGKHLNPDDCYGEFIGVAKFAGEFARRFRANVFTEISAGNEMAYFEQAIDTLPDKSLLEVIDVSKLACVEVDFPDDYLHAWTQVLPQLIAR